jgi:hypothetical protein
MQVLRITFLPETHDDSVNESTLAEMLLLQGMDSRQFVQAIESGSISVLVKPSRGGELMKVRIYWARKALIKLVVEDCQRRLEEVQDNVCISDFFFCEFVWLTRCTD